MRGTEKISSDHLSRVAIVYIRQSTMAQVREHTESTARQYALADEAIRLGWTRQRVEVIDSDLGISGRSADGRPGFKELVGRVCLGEIGAILGQTNRKRETQLSPFRDSPFGSLETAGEKMEFCF